jgi:hypothetical protein
MMALERRTALRNLLGSGSIVASAVDMEEVFAAERPDAPGRSFCWLWVAALLNSQLSGWLPLLNTTHSRLTLTACCCGRAGAIQRTITP